MEARAGVLPRQCHAVAGKVQGGARACPGLLALLLRVQLSRWNLRGERDLGDMVCTARSSEKHCVQRGVLICGRHGRGMVALGLQKGTNMNAHAKREQGSAVGCQTLQKCEQIINAKVILYF